MILHLKSLANKTLLRLDHCHPCFFFRPSIRCDAALFLLFRLPATFDPCLDEEEQSKMQFLAWLLLTQQPSTRNGTRENVKKKLFRHFCWHSNQGRGQTVQSYASTGNATARISSVNRCAVARCWKVFFMFLAFDNGVWLEHSTVVRKLFSSYFFFLPRLSLGPSVQVSGLCTGIIKNLPKCYVLALDMRLRNDAQ